MVEGKGKQDGKFKNEKWLQEMKKLISKEKEVVEKKRE